MIMRKNFSLKLVALLVSVTGSTCIAQAQSSETIHGITPAVTPLATTNVTTTGGTSGQVPVFNGTSTVVNSNIFTTSFGIGINHGPGTGIAFDVLGKMVVRGIFDLGRTADATTSAGTSSNVLQFHSQAFNSAKGTALNPFFEFRSEPIGNNSASTGAKFNVLYSDGTTTEAETGLSINGNGTINFAPGQTFAAAPAPLCIAVNGGFGAGGTTFSAPSFPIPAVNSCAPWSGITKTATTVVLITSGAACVSSDGTKLTLNASSADPDFVGAGSQALDYIQVTRANTSSPFTNGGTDQGYFSGGAAQTTCTASLLTLPSTHD